MNKILLPRIVSVLIFVLLSSTLHTIPAYADTSHCGTISVDETWSNAGNVHIIDCDVYVATGATLTINPDVVVKLAAEKSLVVDGALRVEGTTTNPIYFTSIKDDTIGGDTNGDGGNTIPARGDWGRIEFRDSSNDATSLIDHADIRYGGADYAAGWNYYGAVTLDSASPTIQNTTITESESHGIRTTMSTPSLICNNIYDNGDGIENRTTDVIVIAENQWWGSASGPYHPATNPTGTGNGVSNGVKFLPWLTTPCGSTAPDQHMIYLPIVTR